MEFQKLLLKICKVLQDLNIPYAVTGGYAVSVWGRPRSTFDIDVIIELYKSQVKELIISLKKISEISYISEEAVTRAINRSSEFNYIHADSGIKIDFFVISKDQYSKEKLKRRVAKKISKQTVYFVSPEDLILSKLIWYQKSKSSKQIEDVESIIKISGKDLDKQYLIKWAKKIEVKKILDQVVEKIREHLK